MDKIQINSLVSLRVEQIKITGKLSFGGKELPATINKTLDTSIIQKLPTELIGSLTTFAFGEDFTADELLAIAENLKTIAEQKALVEQKQNEQQQLL